MKKLSLFLAIIMLLSVFSVLRASAESGNAEPEPTQTESTDPNYPLGKYEVGELGDGYSLFYVFMYDPPWDRIFYVTYGGYIFYDYYCEGEQGHRFTVEKGDEVLMLSEAFARGISDIDTVVALIRSRTDLPIPQNHIVAAADFKFPDGEPPTRPLNITMMYAPRQFFANNCVCKLRYLDNEYNTVTLDMEPVTKENGRIVYQIDIPYGENAEHQQKTEFLVYNADGSMLLERTVVDYATLLQCNGRLFDFQNGVAAEVRMARSSVRTRYNIGDGLTPAGRVGRYTVYYNMPMDRALCEWERSFNYGRYKFAGHGGQTGSYGAEDLGVFLVDSDGNTLTLDDAYADESIDFDKIVKVLMEFQKEYGVYYSFSIIDEEAEPTEPSSENPTAEPAQPTTVTEPTQPATEAPESVKPVKKPAKKANTITVRKTNRTVKAKKLRKSKLTLKVFTVKRAKGRVTYKRVSGSKRLKLTKTGKITIKKGTPKGTYKIKVKLTAKGNARYKPKSVVKTVKISVSGK